MACATDPNPSFSRQNSQPLAALRQTGLELLFHSWRGASGRRYICSVYDVEQQPAFDCSRAVVIAVRRDAAGEASIAFVFQPDLLAEACPDSFSLWALRARQCGAREWHVHLLAASAEDRACAARDLSASAKSPGRPAIAQPPVAPLAVTRLAS